MRFSSSTVVLLSPWLLAALLPPLLAFSRSPDPSFFNTAAALLAWGGVLLGAGHVIGGRANVPGVCGGLLVAVIFGWALNASQQGPRALVLGAASIVLGWMLARRPAMLTPAISSLFAGYALAVVAALAICALQFFAPHWTDGRWLAESRTVGRAVGNLRQPNLQATMAIWGAIAAAWLASRNARMRLLFPVILCGSVVTVALTGSRTGMVLTGLLLLWGLLDRGLPSSVRRWLMGAPLLMVAGLLLLSLWAHATGGSYFVETRAQSGGDISSSRFLIWSNTLQLIRAHPWTGVGWGNFNFAWTLTDFAQRPVAFFDHAHNLPLQLAVELGVPAALALGGGGFWLAWHCRRALVLPDAVQAATARAVTMMLGAVLLHSLLEYPLWYAYFLLPAGFLAGLYLGLGWPHRGAGAARPGGTAFVGSGLLTAGALTVLATLWAIADYQRIAQIFDPQGAAGARQLAERIRDGQRSRWFGVHADYAAVTTAARPAEVFASFERPLHRLIDARLMVSYARALDERGERDKAVYVAQRLREFRHPLGEQLFAACAVPRPRATALPFQCETQPVPLGFRDFQGSGP